MTKSIEEINFSNPDIQAAYEKSLLADCDMGYLLENLSVKLPLYERPCEAHVKIIIESIIKSTDSRLRLFG